ncbi:MAG: DUF899 domain-containing protein [Solirubrobacterales bacterium]
MTASREAARGLPPVVTDAEWRATRRDLLAHEKAHTRNADALAAERRRLPMVRVTKEHELTGADGAVGLDDLFEGRPQLIVVHHMLRPADPSPCPGCGMCVDSLTHPAHLNARGVSLAIVADAPIDEIEAFRRRMGWEVPWYSVLGTDFNRDFDALPPRPFGLNVFLRDDRDDNGIPGQRTRIYRTYHTTARGMEALGSAWTYLDLTPYGRQETWEASPADRPQWPPYEWWRLHDEYEDDRGERRTL